MDLNKVVLTGRLTRNPELKYLQTGTPVATFTLAVNRPKRDGHENEADFLPVVVWGSQAENAQKYLRKGSEVVIAGKIQTRTYEKDGYKRYITEIVAREVKYTSNNKKVNNSTNESGIEGFEPMDDEDDDIPF